MRAQKAIGQRLVFAQQAQQQVLRLYVRRAELAGLVSCKEDYAPGFLCVPLEHIPSPRCSQSPLPETSLCLSGCVLRTPPERSLSVLPALSVTRELQIAAPDETYHLPNSAEKPKNCPSPAF